ncbi:5-formyltetrahydrofolate cyclo-ligase [Methylomarinum vadi]|uniref:5-formyltetrahydrofolate cyclo-ligase n=1 Tax=Methylomarinum vadi TaxID=438855 RepID=UPI0004DED51D|nr:5-formyltetrahydrofolate cyclo-ligase [Methylomarinum vadi]
MTLKQEQRRQGYAARRAQTDKKTASRIICRRFMQMPEYLNAETVMWYLHCRSEVRTLEALQAALESDKRCVIPYCTVDEQGNKRLGLWRLQNLNELEPGTWGILEPPRQRWLEPGKKVAAEQLDLIMVPGVAFDRRGGRLGNGAGYYDRLLAEVRPDTVLAGVCYESQLVDRVEMDRHDVAMNKVITELTIYRGDRG